MGSHAEWYLNSLQLKDSPTYKHHVETYGANFDYCDFAPIFNKDVQKWKPAEWAKLFRDSGAHYVVLTSKHHDGFRLWPSHVQNPKRPTATITAKRDLVGELTAAVRSEGLKMGLYYSGGLDWTFEPRPIATRSEVRSTAPQTGEYARYVDAPWRELIERYQPSVMWNDITYPKAGKLTEIFSEHYNRVPEGVINDRFGVDFSDFTTPEYSHYGKITPKKVGGVPRAGVQLRLQPRRRAQGGARAGQVGGSAGGYCEQERQPASQYRAPLGWQHF